MSEKLCVAAAPLVVTVLQWASCQSSETQPGQQVEQQTQQQPVNTHWQMNDYFIPKQNTSTLHCQTNRNK